MTDEAIASYVERLGDLYANLDAATLATIAFGGTRTYHRLACAIAIIRRGDHTQGGTS